MKRMSELRIFGNLEKLDGKLEDLKSYLQEASVEEKSAYEVEKRVWKKILEIGHQALGWFLNKKGQRDKGKNWISLKEKS